MFLKYGSLLGINFLKGDNESIKITTNLELDLEYYSYLNNLLEVSKYQINLYNSKGKIIWEYKIEDKFHPNIYIKDNYMVLSNNSIGEIYLFNNKKEILNLSLEEEISNIFLDNQGNIIVEYKDYGYKKKLDIMNKYGELKYSINIDNEAIIDVIVKDNANKIFILQSISNSINIGTKLNCIDINNSDKINEIASLNNKFIFSTQYIDNDLIMLTKDSILKLDVNKKSVEEILDFSKFNYNIIDLNYNYYSFIEKNDKEYILNINKYDNKKISTININSIPKYIRTDGIVTYLVFQDNILVVNKWGIILDKFDINIPPKDIIIYNGSKTIALIYTNRIEILNI